MPSPIVIVSGHFLDWRAYQKLADRLRAAPYGRDARVARIEPMNWWRSSGADFRPVIDAIADAVERTADETGAAVTVVGHSAGGRLTRKYLGEDDYNGRVYGGHRFVSQLVCLGTPHHSWDPASRVSTRWANEHYPGAYFAPKIRYVNVVSRSVRGNPRGTLAERTAYTIYARVGNDGDVWGDGIIPEHCAVLDGAEQITIEGVYHLPIPFMKWYDDPATLTQWATNLP